MRGTKATFRSFVLFASSFVCLASAQQPLLQITSPSNQSTVLEGQTLNIAVFADPSVQGIYVMTEHPLPSVQPTSNSNLFSLPLPTNIPPGVYKLTAVGFVGTSDVESVPIQIDVERQDGPVSISVKPRFVTIGQIGSTQPINVQGTFSDGSVLSLKNSFLISYASETPSVVTVAPGGLLTAVGPGQATVSVLYGTLGQPGFAATTFQVIVPPPSPTGPAPVITSVTPTSGTPGVTQVTVTGSNFGNVQGSGFVQFGTLSAASVNSWTNQQIVATVPTGSMPGVALVYQNGLYSNQVPFTTVVPSITSLSPTSGTGGTPVTIIGTNFGSTQGTSTILFNGAWTNAANWSNSSITATVSPYATSGNVVVIVNGVPSNAVPFTTAPSISGISPTMGIAGASVTITGSNFGQTQGTSTVTFNGIVASPTAWGATSISVSVPAGATSGPVVVTVNGVSSNLSAFTVGQIQPLSIDARVSADSSSAASTISTGAFSTTSGNELLLAFVSADASSKKSPNTTVTAISGGGLTWQLVQRTNAQLGTSEIWRAFAKNVLSNVAVTVTLSQSVAKSVTIVSFIGADPTGINGSGAIGAVGTANAATGAPTASLVTTRNNSWVFGVGNDWDNAISRTPGPNQSLVHQYLATVNDTYWVQSETATPPTSGTTVVLNDTAPTGDRYNFSLVEVLPAQANPPSTGPLALDVQVSSDQSSASSTNSTPSFSTNSPNELLLAFVSADNTAAPNTTVTGMSGAGLTWQLVQRTNTQLGTAEIWRAFATTQLSNVAATVSLSQNAASSATVVSFVGADPSGANGAGAIGAVGSGNANPGAPTASIVTTRNYSWIFAVGNDWDEAISRLPGGGQSLVHQFLAAVNDTYWVQAANTPTSESGTTVVVNDTAPISDRFNLSVVEVLPINQ